MDMESLKVLLGEQWNIYPAGGATGEAYIADLEHKKLFLKRNSSPFLAVLSAEGIVPKLLWTKRLENGDVISAQQWLPSVILEPENMTEEKVGSLLKKIHSSKEMLSMLKRIRKQPYDARRLFDKMYRGLDKGLVDDENIARGIAYLLQMMPSTSMEQMAVCHGDVNHNNWILDKDNQLYLIDWDGAIIADPAMDIGMLLYCYIPTDKWESWLQQYGLRMTKDLLHRMKWYVILQTITMIQWYKTMQKKDKRCWDEFLRQVLADEIAPIRHR